MNRLFAGTAFGSLILVTTGAAFDTPRWTTLEQNTRTVEWDQISRITVAQKSSRMVRISGPWMDYISGVNASGGVFGRNIDHPDGKTTLVLEATDGATRGDRFISVSISCPFGGNLIGCNPGPVLIPIKVFETGPITSISPSGTVPPNTEINFDLQGDRLDVAVLLPRLLTLKNASIVSKTSSSMRVRGTTPACGYIDVALSDIADTDREFPYRKGGGLQSVLAGTICGHSLVPPPPTFHQCPAGQNWNSATNSCQ